MDLKDFIKKIYISEKISSSSINYLNDLLIDLLTKINFNKRTSEKIENYVLKYFPGELSRHLGAMIYRNVHIFQKLGEELYVSYELENETLNLENKDAVIANTMLEYVLLEILDVSKNYKNKRKSSKIKSKHIRNSIKNDKELFELFFK